MDVRVGLWRKLSTDNWCFWTVVLEKTLESPLDCKEIQPVHSEGDQHWDFFGGNNAEAETPVLWPPHAKSWLIGKDSDAGRDWGQEEKWMTEDEMAGWHHWLDGRESEWTPGVGDGQGGLACCNSWGRKESDRTEWLNWTELKTCWGGVNARKKKKVFVSERRKEAWLLSRQPKVAVKVTVTTVFLNSSGPYLLFQWIEWWVHFWHVEFGSVGKIG